MSFVSIVLAKKTNKESSKKCKQTNKKHNTTHYAEWTILVGSKQHTEKKKEINKTKKNANRSSARCYFL